MVKTVLITLDDKIHAELKEEKGSLSWREFLIDSQRLKIGDNMSS